MRRARLPYALSCFTSPFGLGVAALIDAPTLCCCVISRLHAARLPRSERLWSLSEIRKEPWCAAGTASMLVSNKPEDQVKVEVTADEIENAISPVLAIDHVVKAKVRQEKSLDDYNVAPISTVNFECSTPQNLAKTALAQRSPPFVLLPIFSPIPSATFWIAPACIIKTRPPQGGIDEVGQLFEAQARGTYHRGGAQL